MQRTIGGASTERLISDYPVLNSSCDGLKQGGDCTVAQYVQQMLMLILQCHGVIRNVWQMLPELDDKTMTFCISTFLWKPPCVDNRITLLPDPI